MEDYLGSLAQGSVLFSDSADWEAHAGPIDPKMCRPTFIPNHVKCLAGTAAEKLAASRVLTILTSEDAATQEVEKCRADIVAAGAPGALLAMLAATEPGDAATAAVDTTTSTLAKEAAAATLTNLCAQNDSRALVVEAGATAALCALLGQDVSDEMLKYACGAIGNLARESEENQDAIAAAGGIPKLIAIVRAVGIVDEEEEPKEGDEEEGAEADNGLELNASIALRKLAIGHKANYAAMQEELTESELKYFLHGVVSEPTA